MSITRLCLRVATLEALLPSAVLQTGPYPTSAGHRVFDSLEAPINDLDPNERKPVIVVYTEEDNADPGQRAGGPPFICTVDLLFEISVAQVGDDGEGEFVGTPATDAEAEATLDFIEAQIKFALCYGPTGKFWRDEITARRITDINSLPHRTSEEGVRLARRSMRMKVRIEDDAYDPGPLVTPAGIARLPAKAQNMLAYISASSYGQAILRGLAAFAPVMPTATPLQTVGLDLQPGSPPAALDTSKRQIAAEVDNLDA